MFYHVTVLTALAACIAGAPSGASNRIAGGTQAAPGEYPYVVSVSFNDSHICGGFIYNDRWIVTAHSCIVGRDITLVKVTVGSISLINPDPEEQKIGAFSFAPHPQYNSTTKLNDIALIELSRPIVFGTSAQAIRYDEIDEVFGSEDGEIVGWGATVDGGLPATRLRYASIESLAADCKLYGSDGYNQNYMICAGYLDGSLNPPTSPCDFDQGTPLTQIAMYSGVEEEIVVGIMSKNKGCVDLTVPSIYTRLSAYYDWLLKVAGQQPAFPGVSRVARRKL